MTSGSEQSVDAVVIGAGPNGLVAANRLADAGWEVLLLEAQPDIGGAVRSDRELHSDFVHDTFSAFYPMAAASPIITTLRLEEHGLRWSHAPAVLGHPSPDGSWAMLHRDLDVTARLLDAEHLGDGDAWRREVDQWRQVGPALLGGLLQPMPPVRAGLRAALQLPRVGGLAYVRKLLSPATALLGADFGGEAARTLLVGNALHTDLPPDGAGSGLIGLLLTMLGQTVGFPVPVGGAGELTRALGARFLARGGRIQNGTGVDKILVERGRAVGVVVAGSTIRARRAVLASVGAQQLYGPLLAHTDLPRRVVRGMRRYRLDPATFKVDWALSGPVPWTSPPEYAPGTVHIADSLDEMTVFAAQLAADTIPDRPYLLMGQMTTTDPSRSPAGTESLWAYTHVPQQARRDAAGELDGTWDRHNAERFADRMQARIERHAPDLASKIISRRILTPVDLESRDANLIGGSVNGGTAALDQQLVFRPFAGLGRTETPIRGLYLASASAHPGGSVHGACGHNAARAAIFHDQLRSKS